MKKNLKIVLFAFLALAILLFVRPQKIYYLPEINGKVVDQNGKPIKHAVVCRIEEESSKNEKYGYFEYTKFKSQSVTTDENGKFKLNQKSKIKWFHTPLDLPVVYCFANFEVSKTGFKTYRVPFNDYVKTRKENCIACENIIFTSKVTLKMNDRKSSMTTAHNC